MMQIYLVGFMGSGKSFTGKRLASLLNRNFIDLDTFIEEWQGLTIRGIFEQFGEPHFREIERQALQQMMGQPISVIATGGGTPCFHDNMEWMNDHGLTIYLDTAQQVLFDRLKDGRAHRPLIKSMTDEGLKAFINTKLSERSQYYLQSSIVYAQKNGAETVAEDLAHQFTNIIGH